MSDCGTVGRSRAASNSADSPFPPFGGSFVLFSRSFLPSDVCLHSPTTRKMETIASLPSAVDSLSSSLLSLPQQITTANLSLLTSLFHTLSSDLQPVLPTLSALQTETILTNSTFLSTNLAQLGSVTAQIPPADTAAASPADLVGIIEIGTTRYDILTFWAPEVWSIVIVYGIAAVLKGALGVMVGRRSVRRTREVMERREAEGKGGRVEGEVAKALLASPARAA